MSFKNKKHFEETKKKISESKIGHSVLEITRKKIRESILKKYASGEKFGFRKGHKPWNKGLKFGKNPKHFKRGKLSKETKQKIRNKLKKYYLLHPQIISQKQRKKISKALKGDKNPNWKGGITKENKRIKNQIEFRLWREAVFARDNWSCQKCGARNGNGKEIYLNPHHIKNFADCIELRTSIENGITLCKNCHKLFHKIYGYKNNTREQIVEFLKVEL